MARHVRDPSSLWKSLYSAAALKNILNKLAKDVSDGFESSSTPFRKDDVGKLKKTVSSISYALPDIEELANNAEVDDLVLNLTEVAYDIEDLLDEAATQRLIMENKVSRIKDLFPGINNPWKPRRDFASDLKIQLRLLDEIALKLPYSSRTKKNQPDVPDPTFFTKTRAALEISSYDQQVVGSEETIAGREEDKERLIHCILSPSSSAQHPIVINVTGDGGIGKTTLVKLVCNDSRLSSSFDFVSWASYHGSLSDEDGLRTLAREIDASAIWKAGVEKQGISSVILVDRLCNILRGRKFLLVVDNIKHELLSGWKQYLELLRVGSTGSTVILISWSCIEIRGSMKLFKLEGISERECWSLFKRIAAFDEDADPSLKDIGRSIVKKCGGSPLAVKTLAGLLRNNKDQHYWEQIEQSKLWGQCNEAWVSWCICLQRVPVELIPSYATVGAGGYNFTGFKFTVDKLVSFWMVQGLLKSTKESNDLIEIGHRFYNELKSMSFLPLNPRHGHRCLLEHDFVECLSEKQTGHVNDRFLPSTRVSSTSTWKARTLALSKPLQEGLISDLKHLRVLSIKLTFVISSGKLPKSVGNLKLLRYLSLSFCRELPDSICKLVNLQTLDLYECDQLKTLPRNMHKLVSMRHLLLSGKSSRFLYKALKSLTSLHHLQISIQDGLPSLGKGLQCQTVLQTLKIHDCTHVTSLPNSINCLSSLKELSIFHCYSLDLTGWEGLFYLRSLKSLRIEGLLGLLELPDGLQSSAGSLEHFAISYCRSLRALPESLERCTRLVDIIIKDCPQLIALPQGIHALKNLQVLNILDCPRLVQTVTGNDWHLISHVPIIYLNREVRRNMDTSTVQERPGPPNLSPSKEIRPASTTSPSEIIPVHENQSSYLSDYDHPPSPIQSYSVQSQCSALPTAEHPQAAPIERSGASPPYGMNINVEVYQDEESRSQECHTTLRLGDETHTSKDEMSEKENDSATNPKSTDTTRTSQNEEPGSKQSLPAPPKPVDEIIPASPPQSIPSATHYPGTVATGLENPDYEERLGNQVLEPAKEVDGKRILLLFGEEIEFGKEMLIQLWMALGLLTDEPMEEIGANCFEKLVYGEYILCLDIANSFYKVNAEKLTAEFDMISEKLKYVILDNGSHNVVASADTLHASVVCDEVDASIFKTLGGFNNLRTLLFLGNHGSRLQQVPRDLFLCYEFLVILDLSGTHIKELPSSATKMINLRYLDISWTFIEVLPQRIDHFKKLQTLKLEGCSHLRRLPDEMKLLFELRHLHLDVLRQLAAIPKGMGALVHIRTLSGFPVGTEEGLKIGELKHLNNIMGKFCIAKLENVQSADAAKEASLLEKRNIKMLELRWSDSQLQEPRNEDESILGNLCPHSDLEEIQIICYPGSRFADWIENASFHKLASITLFRCVHITILPSLGKLPSLVSLELFGLSSITYMDCRGEGDHVAFPNLGKLAVYEMPNVQTWTEAREGDYPILVEVSVKDCPTLVELPSLLYLPSLSNLEVSGCTKLEFVSEKNLSSSLQQLIVEDCPLIEQRCSKEGGEDWHKIQHIPNIWIDQEEIQTQEDI